MSGKKGMRQRPQTAMQRDAATLARLEMWIDEILDGHVTCTKCKSSFEPKEIQPSAVALLKARYDKLRPTLSAVEQTYVNDRDKLTDDQISSQLAATLSASPDVILKVLDVACDQGMAQRIVDYIAGRNQPGQTPLESGKLIPLQGSELH